MVRALAICLLSAGCTLVVDHELSKQAATCPDLIFLDGTANNGGQHFHGGVSAPSFRGPAFPPAGQTVDNYGSTLTFVADGGVSGGSAQLEVACDNGHDLPLSGNCYPAAGNPPGNPVDVVLESSTPGNSWIDPVGTAPAAAFGCVWADFTNSSFVTTTVVVTSPAFD